MIYITLLNGKKVLINTAIIELIEETPDTVIKTTTGRKYIVRERLEELYEAINKLK